MRIALTGNPNSGKTTMYNALTGRNEKVGNWAGVTVEKKEHPIKKAYFSGTEELIAVDLPGAYSMSPFTSEESITSSYVRNEHPDVIRCHHQHCGCHQPEPQPVLHDPAAGTGHPRGGCPQQKRH